MRQGREGKEADTEHVITVPRGQVELSLAWELWETM